MFLALILFLLFISRTGCGAAIASFISQIKRTGRSFFHIVRNFVLSHSLSFPVSFPVVPFNVLLSFYFVHHASFDSLKTFLPCQSRIFFSPDSFTLA